MQVPRPYKTTPLHIKLLHNTDCCFLAALLLYYFIYIYIIIYKTRLYIYIYVCNTHTHTHTHMCARDQLMEKKKIVYTKHYYKSNYHLKHLLSLDSYKVFPYKSYKQRQMFYLVLSETLTRIFYWLPPLTWFFFSHPVFWQAVPHSSQDVPPQWLPAFHVLTRFAKSVMEKA